MTFFNFSFRQVPDPIKGLTKQDILDALNVYQERIEAAKSNNGRWFNVTYSWGDGTTTSTVLATAILQEGIKEINEGSKNLNDKDELYQTAVEILWLGEEKELVW